MDNIIYALESPIDGKVYYVGQSKHGLYRPYSHIKNSHNPKITEWIQSFSPIEPVVRILERELNEQDLLKRESYWINKMEQRGEPILNKVISPEKQLKYADYKISSFIREKRKEMKLTQLEFAKKSGLGLRFIREVEQGKETCRIDKVLQAMSMFGATMVPFVKNT